MLIDIYLYLLKHLLEGASKDIDKYLSTFTFPTKESKKLTRVALLNYCGAAILMPYKLFHKECKVLKYDLELLQNTFATSFEQVAHRVTCLQACYSVSNLLKRCRKGILKKF